MGTQPTPIKAEVGRKLETDLTSVEPSVSLNLHLDSSSGPSISLPSPSSAGLCNLCQIRMDIMPRNQSERVTHKQLW